MARILILDDDQALAEAIALRLEHAGHQCHLEHEGKSALAILQEQEFDLLILDVMLPGMSGFEVCRRIHTDPKLYTIPVLFLSAMSSEEEIAHGLAQGADDFLAKPFSLNVLFSHVESLLAIGKKTALTDTLTSLPGARRIKLEIQKLSNSHTAFAVIYLELLRLNDFGQNAGEDARAKAIRHLGRTLDLTGQQLKLPQFQVGHMGGGHFVCIVPPKVAEQYCIRVRDVWDNHLPEFYNSVNFQISDETDLQASVPMLDTLQCGIFCESDHPMSPQEVFNVLSNLRTSALKTGAGGIHLDRRTSAPH